MRAATLTLIAGGALAILAGAGPGAAQPAAPLGNTEFVAIGGASNFIAFVSPQLVTREGARTTATMIYVLDHTQSNGANTAGMTAYITCADGKAQIVSQIMRDPSGKEVSRQAAPPTVEKPDPETLFGKFTAWVCTGRLPDPQAARYATIEQAVEGGRAILARNAKAPAP